MRFFPRALAVKMAHTQKINTHAIFSLHSLRSKQNYAPNLLRYRIYWALVYAVFGLEMETKLVVMVLTRRHHQEIVLIVAFRHVYRRRYFRNFSNESQQVSRR